jgi:hypothetical protein
MDFHVARAGHGRYTESTSRSSLDQSDGNRPLDRHGAMRDERRCDPPARGKSVSKRANRSRLRVSSRDTMFRHPRSSTTTARSPESRVLTFLSRADQLELRGRRNYNRYMLVTKKFVAPNSLEHLRWQRESAEESRRDAVWNRRHGPIPGGASIAPWRLESEGTPQEHRQTAHTQRLAERSRTHSDGD